MACSTLSPESWDCSFGATVAMQSDSDNDIRDNDAIDVHDCDGLCLEELRREGIKMGAKVTKERSRRSLTSIAKQNRVPNLSLIDGKYLLVVLIMFVFVTLCQNPSNFLPQSNIIGAPFVQIFASSLPLNSSSPKSFHSPMGGTALEDEHAYMQFIQSFSKRSQFDDNVILQHPVNRLPGYDNASGLKDQLGYCPKKDCDFAHGIDPIAQSFVENAKASLHTDDKSSPPTSFLAASDPNARIENLGNVVKRVTRRHLGLDENDAEAAIPGATTEFDPTESANQRREKYHEIRRLLRGGLKDLNHKSLNAAGLTAFLQDMDHARTHESDDIRERYSSEKEIQQHNHYGIADGEEKEARDGPPSSHDEEEPSKDGAIRHKFLNDFEVVEYENVLDKDVTVTIKYNFPFSTRESKHISFIVLALPPGYSLPKHSLSCESNDPADAEVKIPPLECEAYRLTMDRSTIHLVIKSGVENHEIPVGRHSFNVTVHTPSLTLPNKEKNNWWYGTFRFNSGHSITKQFENRKLISKRRCVWSEWRRETPCSATCGGGYEMWTRSLYSGSDRDCGVSILQNRCNEESCSISCHLTDWEEIVKCTRECEAKPEWASRVMMRRVKLDKSGIGWSCAELHPWNDEAKSGWSDQLQAVIKLLPCEEKFQAPCENALGCRVEEYNARTIPVSFPWGSCPFPCGGFGSITSIVQVANGIPKWIGEKEFPDSFQLPCKASEQPIVKQSACNTTPCADCSIFLEKLEFDQPSRAWIFFLPTQESDLVQVVSHRGMSFPVFQHRPNSAKNTSDSNATPRAQEKKDSKTPVEEREKDETGEKLEELSDRQEAARAKRLEMKIQNSMNRNGSFESAEVEKIDGKDSGAGQSSFVSLSDHQKLILESQSPRRQPFSVSWSSDSDGVFDDSLFAISGDHREGDDTGDLSDEEEQTDESQLEQRYTENWRRLHEIINHKDSTSVSEIASLASSPHSTSSQSFISLNTGESGREKESQESEHKNDSRNHQLPGAEQMESDKNGGRNGVTQLQDAPKFVTRQLEPNSIKLKADEESVSNAADAKSDFLPSNGTILGEEGRENAEDANVSGDDAKVNGSDQSQDVGDGEKAGYSQYCEDIPTSFGRVLKCSTSSTQRYSGTEMVTLHLKDLIEPPSSQHTVKNTASGHSYGFKGTGKPEWLALPLKIGKPLELEMGGNFYLWLYGSSSKKEPEVFKCHLHTSMVIPSPCRLRYRPRDPTQCQQCVPGQPMKIPAFRSFVSAKNGGSCTVSPQDRVPGERILNVNCMKACEPVLSRAVAGLMEGKTSRVGGNSEAATGKDNSQHGRQMEDGPKKDPNAKFSTVKIVTPAQLTALLSEQAEVSKGQAR